LSAGPEFATSLVSTDANNLSFAAHKTIKSLELALVVADNYLVSSTARFRHPHMAFGTLTHAGDPVGFRLVGTSLITKTSDC
jgi:hypothetical protein